jgi:type IX secretion system PorP/SprF family membrane protein
VLKNNEIVKKSCKLDPKFVRTVIEKPSIFRTTTLIVFCLSLIGPRVYAQDPEFTQFYANPLYLNPAFAGSNNCPRVALGYRNQWPALSGTFVTTSVSYDQHVDGLYGGLGLMVVSDQAGKGTLNTNRISGMYSYHLKVNRQFSIRAGFEATYFQRSLDWNKLTFGDMIDARRGFIYQTGDQPRGGTVGGIDISAGILGYTDNFYMGFAAHHLNTPNESVIAGDSPMPMKLTGHIGAMIPISQGRFAKSDAAISPNILYRYQAGFQQLNMGLYIKKGALTGGVWYRNKDAFIVLLGVENENFRLGYSYDVTVSRLANVSAGSHELSMQLKFNCKPKKKTFRTISCPSF